MSTTAPYFFISYSREDANLQRRIIAELRGRGIRVWVDIENLIPGSPAWEKEIERSIRGAAGVIVLLSPDSHDSEWVRREISFAEQNGKRVFPVLIQGEEDDSIPLRLSNHQRVDLRRNFNNGLDELANALNDHLGITAVHKQVKQKPGTVLEINPGELRKFVLPILIALIGVACVAGLALAARFIYANIDTVPTQLVNTPPDIDPVLTPTIANIHTNEGVTGRIVYTCQVNKENTSDQICVINADGSDQRQLTNSHDNQDASFAPDGQTILFVSNRTGNYEIYEMDLSGHATQLTDFKSRLSLPDVSPDNKQIAFTNRVNGDDQIWLMDRDGKNAHLVFKSDGDDAVAPTWSPEGDQILFAIGKDSTKQLFIMGLDGRDPQLVSNEILTPGRTDWSRQGLIGYFTAGNGWDREVWTIYPDGSGMTQVTQGGNSQGPSFSPGGRYITYTAYTGIQQQDIFSCEIFVMDLYTAEKWQLTHNDYCDYQPRWGS